VSHPTRPRVLGTTALFLLLLHLFTPGCTTQQADPPPPESVSASFSIRARDVESRSGVTALAFSYAEISRIVIDVKERDSGHVLLVNVDLALSDGVWSGTLPFLPKGKTLTFSARALSDSEAPLFSGATDKFLAQDGEAVPITLAPVSNGQSIELPRIRKISIPTALESEQVGNVAFLVEATTEETLTFELSAAPGGGAFSPTSGPFTLTALVGTFVIQYVPPRVTQETDFEHQVKVTNKAGHSVSTTFKTKVKPPGKTDGVADTELKALFNPVINSLSAYRQLGTSDVLFEAGITDDSPPEEWKYAWSFTPSDGAPPEPRPGFTSNTNPSTLQHYSALVRGEVTLAVTDAQGGTTTVRYVLQPNQFPDNPMADSGVLSLRAGDGHTCMLLSGGTVRCWGRNTWGQLGLGHASHVGDDELPDTAGTLPLGEKVEQLAVGGQHTCALLESGMVRCWGRNHAGQLGYGHTLSVGDDEAPSSAGFVNLGGLATRLVAGSAHTCALMRTGEVRCWGLNAQGQLGYGHPRNVGDDESPASAGTVNVGGTVRELAAGASHTCALLETGEVRCWGLNAQGQLGYGHTRNVGDDEFPSGAGTVNVGGTVVQLATSSTSQHTCVRLGTGTVRCWGLNTWGQLGYGHTRHVGDDESPASADVSVGGPVLQVATGAEHTCALLSSGRIKCWGRNESGQLGQGHDGSLSSPPSTTVALDTTAFHLAAGAWHTCARMSTGETRCWGRNTWGQLGLGHTYNLGDNEPPTHTPNTTPLAPRLMETYQSSTTTYSGGFVTFRVQVMDPQGSGLSFSWKREPELGTLATPTTTEDTSEVVWRAPFDCVDGGRPPPRITATVSNALGLSVSHSFTVKGLPTCIFQGPSVLSANDNQSFSLSEYDGSIWAWGNNASGQLGDGTTTRRVSRVQVSGLSLITSVVAGGSHTLALDLDGGIWTWGYNGYGQLGDGTTTRRSFPGHVPWSSGFTAIAAGFDHSVALHHTGTVWTWGYNTYGQLGDGTTTTRRTPVKVEGLDGIIAISAYRHSTIALHEDGTVWAWGDNGSGQLGDGTTTYRRSPVQVYGLGNVAAIAAGQFHMLALHHDGTVSSWGLNNYGQLGDGTTYNRYVPVQVPNFNGVTTIAAGGFHSVALRQDGTVWTWGRNDYGQLGDGTKTRRVSPQQVPELDGMTAIAAGHYHTVAQHLYGSRWSWGYNNYGQLGDGTNTQRSSPGQVLDF
jgi:alpha-tubulin suppressor-like RCC1 family protein